MSWRQPQNPGLGGLDELTNAEELFVQNIAGLTYSSGDVLYHDGSNLQRLAKGTNGQYLKLDSGIPAWGTIAGGGDMVLADAQTVTGAKTFNAGTLKVGEDVAVTSTATELNLLDGITVLSGSNTGDQTITLTGDITGSGTGSFATTIGADKVHDSMIDWGTGASQVSAVDLVIADAGSKITATEVEGALQENRIAIDTNTTASHTQGTDTALGVQAGNLDMGGFTIENVNVIKRKATCCTVHNNTGVSLVAGICVYPTGVVSSVVAVAKCDNTDKDKMPCLGVISATITNGNTGCAVCLGIKNMDTSGFTGNVGDRVYVQSDGTLDTVEPTSGSVQRIGILIVKAVSGQIYIHSRGRKSSYASADEHPVLRMGSDAGHAKVEFKNYANVEKATIDENGNLTLDGTVDGIDIATDVAANTTKTTNATHTGEVTGATALTIAADAVTYDKMQDTSATDKILGRSTAGAGTIEEIACTAAGRAILDDADASAQRTTLSAAATDQTMYIGTTAVAINRTTAALTLAGITLTTPNIGTPSAGTLTNCDGYPTGTKTTKGALELATTAEVNTGTDTTRAIPVDQFVASKRNIRWLVFNLVEAGTDCAVASNIGGDWVSPIAGTILQSDSTPFYLYATNSTAGVTGTMVVDISLGGTSIMTTNKLDFDTTEKTTTTAATPPDVTDTTIAVGDILTIDIDSVHSGTASKGLIVYLGIRE